MFTETPHFLMIEEVVVRFELLSCLGAVLSHKNYVAHIHSVLIENVEVYIEKLHQNQSQNQNVYLSKGKDKEGIKNKTECNSTLSSGKASINFYCAIGEIEEEVVVREDYTKRVHTYVSSMFSSMHGSIPPTVIKKTENIFTVSNKSSAQTSSKSLSFRSEKCSSSNSVKNDFEAGRFHDISMLNMSDDEAATAIKENISNILKEKEKEKEREKEKEKEKDKDRISSGKAAFAEIFGLTSRMTSSSEMLTGSAMSVPLLPPRSPYSNNSPSEPLQTNKDKGDSSPADNNSDNDDDEKNNFFSFWDKDKEKDKDKDKEYERNDIDQSTPSNTPERLQEHTQETNDTTTTIKKIKNNKKKSPHFGIKYRFQIDLLTVKDLRVHAQELLYPTHGEINDSKTIKLSNFTLDKKQLSSKIEKPKNSTMNSNMFVNESISEKKIEKGIVDGSYADEILHRIVTVIQYEIVAKNKLSLASNLFGAAANHTASAVRVAATTAKRGVADSVIAHNPKELFHMATRVINKTVYSQKVHKNLEPNSIFYSRSFILFLILFLNYLPLLRYIFLFYLFATIAIIYHYFIYIHGDLCFFYYISYFN